MSNIVDLNQIRAERKNTKITPACKVLGRAAYDFIFNDVPLEEGIAKEAKTHCESDGEKYLMVNDITVNYRCAISLIIASKEHLKWLTKDIPTLGRPMGPLCTLFMDKDNIPNLVLEYGDNDGRVSFLTRLVIPKGTFERKVQTGTPKPFPKVTSVKKECTGNAVAPMTVNDFITNFERLSYVGQGSVNLMVKDHGVLGGCVHKAGGITMQVCLQLWTSNYNLTEFDDE